MTGSIYSEVDVSTLEAVGGGSSRFANTAQYLSTKLPRGLGAGLPCGGRVQRAFWLPFEQLACMNLRFPSDTHGSLIDTWRELSDTPRDAI